MGFTRRLLAVGATIALSWNTPARSGSDLFEAAMPLHRFELQLDENPLDSLRRAPRTEVPARVRVDGRTPIRVGLHLKGGTGSFRPIDDRPSLTLSTSDHFGSERLLGTTKLHLNNGVEDPSRWREILGRQLLGELGLPTPSATHARVVLNGRDLGLYVLIEGFTPDWLERTFPGMGGTLFEPMAGTNGTAGFRRITAQGRSSPARLPRAFLAAPSVTAKDRWSSTASCINESALIDFIAAEVLLAHPDGYSLAHNNFRLWAPSDGSGLRWIPHGLDRLFGAADLPWPPHMAGPMAEAIMTRPEGGAEVFHRIQAFRKRVSDPATVKTHLERRMERLRPHLSRSEWAEVRDGTDLLMAEWKRRWEGVERQRRAAEPLSMPLGAESVLAGWSPDPAPGNAELSEVQTPDGGTRLRILATDTSLVGWTWTGTLPPGRYRFEARVRLADFAPLPLGEAGGVFVQKTGHPPQEWLRSESLTENPLRLEFTVESASTPTRLRIAFRGRRGVVEVDTKHITLSRTS